MHFARGHSFVNLGVTISLTGPLLIWVSLFPDFSDSRPFSLGSEGEEAEAEAEEWEQKKKLEPASDRWRN